HSVSPFAPKASVRRAFRVSIQGLPCEMLGLPQGSRLNGALAGMCHSRSSYWRLGFVPCISNGMSIHIPSDSSGFIELQRIAKP
ncbi:MAG: hypothetical protein LBF66_03195, partial [Holosporales bacterium]|nr:hypothetical protein [Holosporales bacterium]